MQFFIWSYVPEGDEGEKKLSRNKLMGHLFIISLKNVEPHYLAVLCTFLSNMVNYFSCVYFSCTHMNLY